MAYSNTTAQSLTGAFTTTGAITTTTTLPYYGMSASTAAYTLRDELASRATEKDIEAHRGITSDGGCTPITEEEAKNCPKDWVRTREQAKYHYADAMIAARNL
jgi:hypothetical protein